MAGADSPDWGAVAPARYIGAVGPTSGGVGATLDVTPNDYESMLLIRTPAEPAGIWLVQVVDPISETFTFSGQAGPGEWVAAWVNKARAATWQVAVANFGPNDDECDVFASSGMPVVTLASSNSRVLTVSRPRAYDALAVHVPAGQTKGTTTLAGVTGRRWVASLIMAKQSATAATTATTQLVHLIDGPSGGANVIGIWRLTCAAAVASKDEVIIPSAGIIGSPGTAMTLEFTSIPPANMTNQVQLGAYLIDNGEV